MKYGISARPLTAEENKEFGIFVSHSNDDDTFLRVCEAFEKAGVPHLVDKQIEIGSMNFADEIKRLIDTSRLAVVVITAGALASSWVNFEIGVLSGENKRILLFDPKNLLGEMRSKHHLDKFPMVRTLDELVEKVKSTGYFSDLFVHETANLTKKKFEERASENVVPVRLTLSLSGFADLALEEYRFTALVTNFGDYNANYGEKGLCFQSLDESDNCPVSCCGCALTHAPDIDAFPECVAINKVVGNAIVRGNELTFILPLHKIYGTTFKIFADVADSKQCDKLFALLEDANLAPSISESGNAQRIYISLPDSNWDGVFRLKDEFSNNFLCPSILENTSDD